MKNKIILWLILISAFLLRIYKSGQIPFWEDELWTLYRSNLSVVATLKTLVSLPVHPPFYYLLMNLWVKLFGANEFILRFPSIIFSMLSVFFVFKLGESLYNSRIGLYAALLLAFSPFSIYYSQEAKGYAMSWALCIISFWLFYRLMKKFRAADLAAYILVTAASWYASYIGVIYTLIQFFCLFVFQKSYSIRKWLWVYILIIVLYLPWFKIFLANSI
ncbi:MAG: glycosyltransferase family 39 protein [Candidatus Omnitrophica bacterium]|nr:glycosyltransferase family 39 protein [Candidatus Omnitrophota bacterium]